MINHILVFIFILNLVNIIAPTSALSFPNISKNPDDIRLFLIHTPPKNGKRYACINFRNDSSITREIEAGNFDTSLNSVFLIHGYTRDGVYFGNPNGTQETSAVANFFFFSWGKMSGHGSIPEIEDILQITPEQLLNVTPLYFEIVLEVLPIVWKRVSEYLTWLSELGVIDPKRTHLVGHSLGAHIMGAAANLYRKAMGRKISRVTGLDPSGPLFDPIYLPVPPYLQRKLTFRDAEFVDCYHTNRGLMGDTSLRDCHVDFKVNNGFIQPGCGGFNEPIANLLTFYLCSHFYSVHLFSISDTEKIYGCLCPDALGNDLLACNRICPRRVIAGYYTPRTARGYRHILLQSRSPKNRTTIRPPDSC